MMSRFELLKFRKKTNHEVQVSSLDSDYKELPVLASLNYTITILFYQEI